MRPVVKQDALGQRGFARIDVGGNTDVSDLLKGPFAAGH